VPRFDERVLLKCGAVFDARRDSAIAGQQVDGEGEALRGQAELAQFARVAGGAE
jgi:hypothetical protein